jgi:hypothetical protein
MGESQGSKLPDDLPVPGEDLGHEGDFYPFCAAQGEEPLGVVS